MCDNKDGNNYRDQGQIVAMVAIMRRSCNTYTHMHMHAQVHKSRQLCTMMDAQTWIKTQDSRHVHDFLLKPTMLVLELGTQHKEMRVSRMLYKKA